jgi:hypothetical protein
MCYFANKIYSLPSLIEIVLTNLAKLFCQSEFIVSPCLVETIRRSYFARQIYSLHIFG